LNQLFFAYNEYYVGDPIKSEEFIALFEKMANNRLIFDRRYEAIRQTATKSLKKWIVRYREQPRSTRRTYRDLYIRTKRLVFSFETFPKRWLTSCQLFLTIKPNIDDPF
jgi:hypothetical protein